MPDATAQSAHHDMLEAAIKGEAPVGVTQDPSMSDFERNFLAAGAAPVEGTPEVPAEIPLEGEPEPEPVVIPEPEPEPEQLSRRYRFDSPTDQAVATMARAEGITLIEAAQRYATANAPVQAVADGPTVESELSTKEGRLGEIRATLRGKVAEAGEIGLTLTPDIQALQDERDDLLLEIPRLQREQERQGDDADFTFDQLNKVSEGEAYQLFPDAKVAGTPLYDGIAFEVERLIARKDPLLDSPERAFHIASKVAAKLGIVPATVNPGSPVVPSPVTPKAPLASQPQRAFNPVPGGVASEAQRISVTPAAVSPTDKIRVAAAAPGAGWAALAAPMAGFFKTAPVSRRY